MKFRLSLALGAALLLAGCATAPIEQSLYLLESQTAPASSGVVGNDAAALIIGEVRLAAFVDQPGMVYQTSEHQVSIASNHRWAAPLATQLRQSLALNLENALADMQVFAQPRGAPASGRQLDIMVTGFHGHFDGKARVAGSWQISGAEGQIQTRGGFNQQVPLNGDGYDALVRALARGWQQAAAGMAANIPPANRSE